ncbi:MAG: aldehyde dehydrogenase family protein, partial [Flavobacteriales bacterium]|nr:aldehyde dehydrogenase family protein [Flavobacteriales bacterium]
MNTEEISIITIVARCGQSPVTIVKPPVVTVKTRHLEVHVTACFNAERIGTVTKSFIHTAANYGPLISQEHRQKVLSYYRKAVEEGATVVTGGGVPDMPAE